MLERITNILVETANVDADKVKPEATLKEDLGIDSLDSVEIVLELETEFDIKIEDDELQGLKTVNDIVTLIERKTK